MTSKTALLLILAVMLCGIAHADWMNSGWINNSYKNVKINIDLNISFSNLTDNSSGVFFSNLSYYNGESLALGRLQFTSPIEIYSSQFPYVNSSLSSVNEYHIECPQMPSGVYMITGEYPVSSCVIGSVKVSRHDGAVLNYRDLSNWSCNSGTNLLTLTHTIYCPALGSNIVSFNYSNLDYGLILHYSFDNGSAYDLSGNGNDGTLYDNTTINQSYEYSGMGAGFDGSGDYIDAGTYNFTYQDEFTFSFWIKISSIPSSYNIFLNVLPSTISSPTWGRGIAFGGSSSITYFKLNDDINGIVDAIYIDTPSFNVWHNVVGTYSQGVMKLYLDSNLMGTHTLNSSNNFNYVNRNTYLGKLGPSEGYYNGSIDEVKIWNRSLSDAEIVQEYLRVRNLTIPSIDLVSPDNGATWTEQNLSLVYKVSATTDVDNCSLYINNLYDLTDTSIMQNQNQYIYKYYPFNYNNVLNWRVKCINQHGIAGYSPLHTISLQIGSGWSSGNSDSSASDSSDNSQPEINERNSNLIDTPKTEQPANLNLPNMSKILIAVFVLFALLVVVGVLAAVLKIAGVY